MDLDSVQSIPLHHAFEIHNGVFVRRVGVSNPPVEVANGTVSPAGGARGVVGDELTHSYTSRPLTHPSLAPTPSASVKSERKGRFVSMTMANASPPVEFPGTNHGHNPFSSWLGTASTAEPPSESFSHVIHDSSASRTGQFTRPDSPKKNTTLEFRGGKRMLIPTLSPDRISSTVPFWALRTRVLDEIRNVDGQVFFGGEGDLLPHAAEQRTVSLYHQGINRQPTRFILSKTTGERRQEHDDHQYERVQSSMSHGAGTRPPLFKSTVLPSTSRSVVQGYFRDENSKTHDCET